MLRAIAAAKRKNDRIDAGKIADCLRCDFLPECHMASTEIRNRRRILRYRIPLDWPLAGRSVEIVGDADVPPSRQQSEEPKSPLRCVP